jgi:integrase
MPASFKLILAPRADGDGLHDVRLRIIADRVVRYFNVNGVSITPKQWNPAGTTDKENWVKSNHHEHADLNSALFDLLRRAKKLSRAQPDLPADELKRILSTGEDLKPAPKVAALDFIAYCFEALEKEDTLNLTQGTCEVRATCLRKLALWWKWKDGKKPLPVDQLTEEVVRKYDTHLKNDLGNGPTTRRKNLDVLQMYLKRAIHRKLVPRDGNIFEEYDLPTRNAPSQTWLTDAELSAFETVVLPPQQHLARATYFIQYYLHGSRIGVVLKMQWKQRSLGVVRFKMDKGDREKVVEESPQLTALLDSFLPADGSAPDPEAFILPWLYGSYFRMSPKKALQEMKRATAVVNMNLKRAGKKAGIGTHFSSHSSRRTLADNADNLTEDLGVVQGLLGHSARATTEKYTRGRDTPAVHRGAKKVYEQRPMPQVKHG